MYNTLELLGTEIVFLCELYYICPFITLLPHSIENNLT